MRNQLNPIKKAIVRCRKKYSSLMENKYLDLGLREQDTLLVAGTARSGTTWVGDVVAHATKSRIIFEPFLLNKNMEFVLPDIITFDEDKLRWHYQLYISCDHNVPSKYHARIARILKGKIKVEWTEKGARHGVFRRRVIKEIRSNLFLGYIARNWPKIKILLMIRNPHSVVNSLIAKINKGWLFNWNKNDVLAQPELMKDWLQPFSKSISESSSLAERLAHKWCIETYVPLKQLAGLRNVLILRYDRLAMGPAEWSPVSDFLSDHAWSDRLFRKQFGIPSSTTERSSDHLAKRIERHVHLTEESKSNITKIVELYGLKEFLQ